MSWWGRDWTQGTQQVTPLQRLPEAQITAKADNGPTYRHRCGNAHGPSPDVFLGLLCLCYDTFFFFISQQGKKGIFWCEHDSSAFTGALPPQASVEDFVAYTILSR